jgi:small subunit ribosomal protein S20
VATHKSAKKRARQALKRRDRNRVHRSRMRTAVKQMRAALAEGDAEQSPELLRETEGVLRRAVSKGVIPAERASRLVSRLARATHQL